MASQGSDGDGYAIPDLDDLMEEESPVRLFRPGMVLGNSDTNNVSTNSNQPVASTSQIASTSANQISKPDEVSQKLANSTQGQAAENLPLKNTLDHAPKPNVIVVNRKQKENPLLKHLRMAWAINEAMEPDYILGRGCCAYFLSLKYHNLFPTYIYDRYNSLGPAFGMRVLLLMVDVPDPRTPLKELTKFALQTESTLMCCWTFEEAARYLETYRLFENKSPEVLMEKQFANNKGTEGAYECVAEALSNVKKVNKTDAISLMSSFESLEKIMRATPAKLALAPGLGPLKAEQLHSLFRKPFKR